MTDEEFKELGKNNGFNIIEETDGIYWILPGTRNYFILYLKTLKDGGRVLIRATNFKYSVVHGGVVIGEDTRVIAEEKYFKNTIDSCILEYKQQKVNAKLKEMNKDFE